MQSPQGLWVWPVVNGASGGSPVNGLGASFGVCCGL